MVDAERVNVQDGKRVRSRRQTPWRLAGYGGILLMLFVATVVPGWLAPLSPLQGNLLDRLLPPGSVINGHVYWLGTDTLGRDELSRLIWGARVSFVVAMASVVMSGLIGTFLGILSGYFGGVVSIVFMRLADIILSIPFLLLAILIVTVIGPGLISTILVLGATRWPIYTRVAYGAVLQVREAEYIQAARSLGASRLRIILHYVLPNILSPLIVMATLEIGTMIMYEAALSFLGLGIQPPAPSWGNMLADAQNYITQAWWLMTFPGLAVFLVVLSFNRIGDYVQERLDPRLHVRKLS